MTLQTDIFEQLADKYIMWLDEKWTYTFTDLHPYFGMITVTIAFMLYFNQNNFKYIGIVAALTVGAFVTGYASIIQNQGAIAYQATELLTNHRLYATLLVTAIILIVAIKLISSIHAKLKDIGNLNKFLYFGVMILSILLMYTGKEMVFKYAVGVIAG